MTELIFRSAQDLGNLIRQKQVSSLEVVEAHLSQISRYNPALNAMITLDEDGARHRAREADAALARGEVWGWLHGVPFTLKDNIDTAGLRTTMGSPALIDRVPKDNAAVASHLKKAGGVLLGKTNCELFPDNPFGRTHNPWDLRCSANRSSGGSAAALAAGMTALDIGSDLGGSICSPAHVCGVYGLRPTERRVPFGVLPDETLARWHMIYIFGPMARCVADLRLAMQIIAKPDLRDTDVPGLSWREVKRPALRKLRLAWAPTLPGVPVSPDIQAAVKKLAGELDRLGAQIEPRLPDVDFRQQHQYLGHFIHLVEGASKEPPTSLGDYFTLLHQRDQIISAWELFFDSWDALILPPSPISATPLDGPVKAADGTVIPADQPDLDYPVNAFFTLAAVPGCPAVTMPLALDRDNLPIGVQLIGRRWDDERLLAIAERIEEVTGGFRRPPGY